MNKFIANITRSLVTFARNLHLGALRSLVSAAHAEAKTANYIALEAAQISKQASVAAKNLQIAADAEAKLLGATL